MKKNILFFCLVVFVKFLSFAQPANDEPCNAINIGMLTVGTPVVNSGTDYTNVGATTSANSVKTTQAKGYASDMCINDVWYKFQVPNGYYSAKVTLTTTSGKKFTMLQIDKQACTDDALIKASQTPLGSDYLSTDVAATSNNQSLISVRTTNNCNYNKVASNNYVQGEDIYLSVGGVSTADVGSFTLKFEVYGLSGGGCPSCSGLGTMTVTGNGTTLNGTDNYDIADGGTVDLTAVGYTVPSGQNIAIAFFTTKPTLPLSVNQLADLNTVPGYAGSDPFKQGGIPNAKPIFVSTDNNTGGKSGIPGAPSTVWALLYLSDANDAVDSDKSGDACVGTLVQLNYTTNPLPPCGTCAAPNCPIGSIPMYNDRFPAGSAGCTPSATTNCPGSGAKNCQSGVSITGTTDTYQIVTADALGNLGAFIQSIQGSTGFSCSLTSDLYETTDCNGTAIPKGKFSTDANATGSSNNVHNRSAASGSWNPEWKGLTPGKSYVLKTTFNVSALDDVIGYCMDYYGLVKSPLCPTDKTFTTVDWNKALPKNGGNYPFDPFPANPTYTCTDGVKKIWKFFDDDKLVDAGHIGQFPGFQLRITNGSAARTSVLVNVNGVDYSYYGPANNTLASTILDWGTISSDPYDIVEYYLPKGATIKITICDSRGSNQSILYDLYDFSSGLSVLSGTAVVKSGTCQTYTYVLSSPTMTWKLDGGSANITDNNDGSASIDVSKLAAGNHTIDYTFDNGKGCTISATQQKFTVTGGPTITPGTPASVCAGTTSTTMSFTSTGSPDLYSIDWNTAANNAGFVDVVDATLSSTSPQTITLPAGATAATYTGSLTVKKSGGCASSPQNISVILTSGATITGTATVCVGSSTQLATISSGGATPWSSSTTSIATISATGLVQGVAKGTSDITFTDNNGCKGTKTVTVYENPTPSALSSTIDVGATTTMSVTGGSGTPAANTATTPWLSSATTFGTIVAGAGQTATVTGVAAGTTDITYTDDKGCSGKTMVTIQNVIPGCNSINNPSAAQVLCQGADPAAFTVSTSETAVNGIYFVVYPAIFKPANAAAIYSGIGSTGVAISNKLTPSAGTASIDLPPLGSAGSLPVVVAGDYYVYAILDPVPSDVNCRPYAEIKVTIKDSIKPTVTASGVVGNSTTFEWNNIAGADKWGVKGAITATANTPTTWTNLGSVLTASSGTKNTHTTNLIPLGSTAHINITPQDISGAQLACSNTASASIQNPNCTKPVPAVLATSVPSVCEGGTISVIGGLDVSSVSASFKWRIALDGVNWTNVSGADYDVSVPTTLTIPVTKIGMNNALVRLVVTDQATGACSDSTAPIALKINEKPDALLQISPDPAKLCVGAAQAIEVTFLGSKGTGPYVFNYTLDGTAKVDSSLFSTGTGILSYSFDTDNPIDDSTFVLTQVTDKNGCVKNITNQSVKMQVISSPEPTFIADQTIGCYPFTVIFTDKSSITNTNVEWDFGDGSTVSNELGFTKYTFKKAGDFTITFKSTMNGCSGSKEMKDYIKVKERPIAEFSPKKTNISMIEPTLKFINSSSANAVNYRWIFGDDSPVSTEVNPEHTYVGGGQYNLPKAGKYLVQLYAYVNADCWDSTSTFITIDDEQIYYIPNTFTPDGNEFNNTFQPIFTSGYDAQNYHFVIYNRWGVVVFETNNPAVGWDGTFGNKLCATGTYTWKLEFKEAQTEEEHYLTGSVNLLK